jgi:hypothetical protein
MRVVLRCVRIVCVAVGRRPVASRGAGTSRLAALGSSSVAANKQSNEDNGRDAGGEVRTRSTGVESFMPEFL